MYEAKQGLMVMKLTATSPFLAVIAIIATSTASFSQVDNDSLGTKLANLSPQEAQSTILITESGNNYHNLSASNTSPAISFFCGESNQIPTTMVRFASTDAQQDLAFLRWLENYLPANDKPQELCESVSAKLQDYYENNDIDFEYFSLVVRNIDNESVACIEEGMESGCAENGILFSFNDVSNPNDALSEMLGEELQATMTQTRGDFRLPLFNLFPW